MTILYFDLCLLLLQAFLAIQTVDTAPVITASSAEIIPGATPYLDLNCTLTAQDTSGMAALVSLLVSRSNDSSETFSEVASITEFKPTTVNLVTTETLQADGVLDEAGESYIHIRWQHPTELQGGLYQCSALGIDLIGHSIAMLDSTQISVNQLSLQERIENLQNYTKSLEESFSLCLSDIEALQEQITELYNHSEAVETALTCIAAKGVIPHLTYNDHWYFLATEYFYDVRFSQEECQICGGYLVEINDVDEYTVIQTYIGEHKDSHLENVAIGGNDQAKEGTWVLPSTSEILPYTDWLPGEPEAGYHCLWLSDYNHGGWRMMADTCHISNPSAWDGYLCEVPRK